MKNIYSFNLKQFTQYFDHALLSPTMTNDQLKHGLTFANNNDIGAVCVKLKDVELAKSFSTSHTTKICSVVGFPHANIPETQFLYETNYAIQQGATEIDFVIPTSWVYSEEWKSIGRLLYNFRYFNENIVYKAILETAYLRDKEPISKLIELCAEHHIDFVKTSTGFAFTKDDRGNLIQNDWDYSLIKYIVNETQRHEFKCKVKVSGGVKTFGQCCELISQGVERIGTSNTYSILNEAKLKGVV